MSIVPVAIVAGVWYHLAQQGAVTHTLWLGLNVLDSLRALRLTRPNGRTIGVVTRRRAIRESLIRWAVYAAIQQVGSVPDQLFGWLPLYSTIRALVCFAFMAARVSFSESLYSAVIQPSFRRYETRIDLTLLLLHSIISLVYHFTFEYPFQRIRSMVKPYRDRLLWKFGVGSAPIAEVIVDVGMDSMFATIDDDAPQVSLADLPLLNVSEVIGGKARFEARRLDSRSKEIAQASNATPRPAPRVHKNTTARPGATSSEPSPTSTIVKLPDIRPKKLDTAREIPLGEVDKVRRNKRSAAPPPEERKRRPLDGHAIPKNPAPSRPPRGRVAEISDGSAPLSAHARPDAVNLTNSQPRHSTATVDRVNPLSQPPRRIPLTHNTNVPRATPALAKSKSTVELGLAKPRIDEQTKRVVKSAPTRRVGDATPSIPKTTDKRIPSAAERSKATREARRREDAVDVGEKRKLARPTGPEGSKRTRVTIARD